jgi:hypothetical protein
MANGLDSIGRKMYPIGPLLAMIYKTWPFMNTPYANKQSYEMSDYVVQHILGIHARTFDRWVEKGTLREDHADRIACLLGVHPYLIWGDLWFNGHRGCELEECYSG